jgi:hypothetical protein
MDQRFDKWHTPPEARLRLLLVGGVSFSFSFQFLTRLAAVFAEEVGGFGITNGPIQRCSVFIIIWMPIGA